MTGFSRIVGLALGSLLVAALFYIGIGINRQADIEQRSFDLSYKRFATQQSPASTVPSTPSPAP